MEALMGVHLRWFVVLVAIVVAIGCSQSEIPEDATLTEVGQLAPAFELTTLDGKTFNLERERGKVVVIAFFATWCAPCRQELPHLETEVWQRFQGPRFTMVGVGREHGNEELTDFVDTMHLSFQVAGDPDRHAYSKYARLGVPRTIVVAPDGMILLQTSGFNNAVVPQIITTIEGALG
jgi:peroxiredoxin